MSKPQSRATPPRQLVPVEAIERRIFSIRGEKVILDADLAKLYGVTTRRLNEQVRRNRERFPPDFAFLLNAEEFANLKSHFATSSSSWGGRRKLPYAFTEHGTIMAANVLNSPVAVRAGIQVVRAFVRLREILASHKELVGKLDDLERKYAKHDAQIKRVFEIIKKLVVQPRELPRRPLGFIARAKDEPGNP